MAEVVDGVIGEYGPAVGNTSPSNILITGLVRGKEYAFSGRNMGGSTVWSDWSAPVTGLAL